MKFHFLRFVYAYRCSATKVDENCTTSDVNHISIGEILQTYGISTEGLYPYNNFDPNATPRDLPDLVRVEGLLYIFVTLFIVFSEEVHFFCINIKLVVKVSRNDLFV